jgi:hypothetical protein
LLAILNKIHSIFIYITDENVNWYINTEKCKQINTEV